MKEKKKQQVIGLFCAIACATCWGILPVYWKSIESINSFSIMFYRLVLSFVFVFIICIFVYKPQGMLKPLKSKGAIKNFFFAGLTISINWSVYIWAVNAGYIIQTSIGYYIEPIIVTVFGVILFHEKLNKYKVTAIFFAIAGVIIMIISYQQPPTIAFGLAISFALYAAIKKQLQAPALLSLLYETGLMLPIVIPLIIYMEVNGNGISGNADVLHLALLSLSGVFTAVPLILFAFAANRIQIITLGLTEYIAPSLSLIIGIFIYREPFDNIQLLGFLIIWVGLFAFTIGEIKDISGNVKKNNDL